MESLVGLTVRCSPKSVFGRVVGATQVKSLINCQAHPYRSMRPRPWGVSLGLSLHSFLKYVFVEVWSPSNEDAQNAQVLPLLYHASACHRHWEVGQPAPNPYIHFIRPAILDITQEPIYIYLSILRIVQATI